MISASLSDRTNDCCFDRLNLNDVLLSNVQAHHGDGLIRFARLCAEQQSQGACNFIDLAELPPGTSIGRHQHLSSEEEFNLILQGQGMMWRNGEEFTVQAGDLIRNPPSGEHSLRNTGSAPLRIFVFEVAVGS